jgi:glycosyltransferase involved in cell wall biosynthesis
MHGPPENNYSSRCVNVHLQTGKHIEDMYSPSKPLVPHARDTVWPVMVLAHNESDHIVACLDSVYAAEAGRQFAIFVLANGCTDKTEEIVQGYASRHPGVHLVSIEMADKCNAWNVYIHDVLPALVLESDVYFFMDGDCRACPGAFSEMVRTLHENPTALAAGAPPATGRSRQRDRKELLEKRLLVVNLYALTGRFVRHLQQKGVRIPLGLEGDDGLIGALVKWDLDPRRPWDDSRIASSVRAGFAFDSLSWMCLQDWKKYWRRRIRYSRRMYELQLLRPRLKKGGVEAMPVHITEIYTELNACRVQWRRIQMLFDWLALREMHRYAK